MVIKKILIANRGEIALRIIRTCREMGIKTVALCPLPGQEANFLETQLADEYYFLGKEGSTGYLDQKLLIEIAKKSGAEAIHPGYGFLAENWKFAKLCSKKKIKFIGPHFKILKIFEDKIASKKLALKVGLKTLPFSDSVIKSKKDLIKWIGKIGLPFILKAQKGGGGLGLRMVSGKIELENIDNLSKEIQRQMALAFAEVDFFLEKCLPQARHIEVQIIGDGQNVFHLGERDCTLQRRHQKVFEEAPSPFLEQREREILWNLALKIAKPVSYQGIATVEFLVDLEKNFYFLEVNPRIQVEHPVTEVLTKIDLVEQQIRIAQGERIPFSQDDVRFDGWAVEARITAESAEENFRPGTGKIQRYLPPGGQHIFLHSFLHQGQEIYPYFDSLLVKLIAWGRERKEALNRLKRALDEFIIEGVPTTIAFFKLLLENKDFLEGNFNTNFLKESGLTEKLKLKKEKQIGIPFSCPPLIEEKEIAEIIFQIYQKIKREEKIPSASNWLMAERSKMIEE